MWRMGRVSERAFIGKGRGGGVEGTFPVLFLFLGEPISFVFVLLLFLLVFLSLFFGGGG